MIEITLEGEKYTGMFEGEYKEESGTEMVDTEVGRHLASWRTKWYSGHVRVSCSGDRELFAVTYVDEKNLNNLRESFMAVFPYEFRESSLVNRSRVYDLILSKIAQEIKKSGKIVPAVSLPIISLEELVDFGAYPDSKGQLSLMLQEVGEK